MTGKFETVADIREVENGFVVVLSYKDSGAVFCVEVIDKDRASFEEVVIHVAMMGCEVRTGDYTVREVS